MIRVIGVFAVAFTAFSCLGLAANPAAPQLNGISPYGVRRGEPNELTITGTRLAEQPRLIAPFPFTVEPVDPQRSTAESWTFRLKVGDDVALGVYPIRVQTDAGLSNPLLLAIGQLPQDNEKEANNTFDTAQVLPPTPIVVEGQAAGNDVDFYRFAGKKGQVIVIDAQCARIGSGVDPSIRLTMAGVSRRFIASADDTLGLLTDARLVATLPEDGDYVVEISDSRYQGGGRPIYRLLIGEIPVAEEIYPLSGRNGETVGLELRGGTIKGIQIAAASLSGLPGFSVHPPRFNSVPTADRPSLEIESLPPLVVSRLPELREPADAAEKPVRAAAPVVFNGRIDPPGDEDRFVLAVTPGDRLNVRVEASKLGSALDGVLQVLGNGGAAIASADDTTITLPGLPPEQANIAIPDPSVEVAVPDGTREITLVLKDLQGRGGPGFAYRIVVTPRVPAFEISLNDAEISIPKGGTAVVGVTAARTDYAGPIDLTVTNLPAGVTARPSTIGAGQAAGALSLSAAADAEFPTGSLRVIGQAQGPNGPIEAEATKTLVFAQQSNLPVNSLVQTGLPAAPAKPSALTIDSPAEPIEIVHGFGATIPIKVNRPPDVNSALAIASLPLPAGIAVPAANVAENATEGSIPVNSALEAPLGTTTIALQATGKFSGADAVIAIPSVTLNVVRPAEIASVPPTAEVKAGGSVEIKGKLVRRGPFKEAVEIKLDGLPAGVAAEPVAALAPDTDDFTIKLNADAKAEAATANIQVKPAYKINEKDYPAPAAVPVALKVLPAN